MLAAVVVVVAGGAVVVVTGAVVVGAGIVVVVTGGTEVVDVGGAVEVGATDGGEVWVTATDVSVAPSTSTGESSSGSAPPRPNATARVATATAARPTTIHASALDLTDPMMPRSPPLLHWNSPLSRLGAREAAVSEALDDPKRSQASSSPRAIGLHLTKDRRRPVRVVGFGSPGGGEVSRGRLATPRRRPEKGFV